MGSVLQTNKVDVTNVNHLSGYDLTTLLIRGGLAKLKLNANARMVLLYLATCYNERNGSVFPRVATMAEALDISERGVIRALAELTEKGAIIRSKRGRNKNVYIITKKVLTSTGRDVITHGHDDTTSSDMMSLPCNEVKQHEVKEQQQINEDIQEQPLHKQLHKNVVAFSSKSQNRKSVNLEDVPDIIKKKKGVKNPCAYWASLSAEVKAEYLQKEKKAAERAAKKAERKRAELEEKRREREESEKIKNAPPFWMTCSRAEAIAHLKTFNNDNLRRLLKTGYRVDLINRFNIDVSTELSEQREHGMVMSLHR